MGFSKAILRGRFIEIHAYIRKKRKSSNKQPNFTSQGTSKKKTNKKKKQAQS